MNPATPFLAVPGGWYLEVPGGTWYRSEFGECGAAQNLVEQLRIR